ncbi:MAG: serine/threonine protein kinase, partial [Isosphaeraceae bacterium]
HLITGHLAFPGENPIERMGKRINGRPVPITDVRPDVPRGLVRVIETMMAHKPQDRYPTADAAADALQALLKPKVRSSSQERRDRTRDQEGTPADEANPVPAPLTAPPPAYPRWLLGFASLAERRPTIALTCLLGALLGSFALGFLVAWMTLVD